MMDRLGEKEGQLYKEQRKMKSRSAEELAEKIYKDKSKAANVRQLRKQVNDKLVGVVREEFVPGNKGSAKIRRLLDFADFLIAKERPQLALEYLQDAENEANANRAYELLENIYHYKLDHCHELGIDPKEAFNVWQLNHKRYVSYMVLLFAKGLLLDMLKQHRRAGVVPDKDDLMKLFYTHFNPDEDEKRDPSFMLRLAQILRRVLITTKEYWRIESAIREIYDDLLEKNCFTDKDDGIRRSFLLMLAQATFRNRKFDESESLLKEVRELLAADVPHSDPDYIAIQIQKAAIFLYTNRVEQAKDMTRKLLYGPEPIENEENRINLQINLAVCYFCLNDIPRSLEQLEKLNQTDEEFHKLLGPESNFKKRMIFVVVCHAAGNFEEAEQRLVDIIADYKEFFRQDLYLRVNDFLEFVLRWFRDRSIITNPDFHREVRDAGLSWGDKEDIHAMFFFSWFRAPMLGQEFYATFQARLREEGADWDYPFTMA